MGYEILFVSNASNDVIGKLLSTYKIEKYLHGVFGKAVNEFNDSEDALQQAVAIKYRYFLSWRNFKLVGKTQSSVFNVEK